MSRFSQNLFSSVRRTRTLVSALGRNVFSLNLLLIALIATLAVFYIVQVNRTVTEGYRIRDLETMIGALQLDTRNLEIQLAEARSMDAVSRKVPMLGLVKASMPTYLDGTNSAMTLNR